MTNPPASAPRMSAAATAALAVPSRGETANR